MKLSPSPSTQSYSLLKKTVNSSMSSLPGSFLCIDIYADVDPGIYSILDPYINGTLKNVFCVAFVLFIQYVLDTLDTFVFLNRSLLFLNLQPFSCPLWWN